MKRKIVSILAVLFFLFTSSNIANAHVGVQLRGNTLVAGSSTRIWLSLGHGCTYNNNQYGTRIFSVQVPSVAGKPTPEFHV